MMDIASLSLSGSQMKLAHQQKMAAEIQAKSEKLSVIPEKIQAADEATRPVRFQDWSARYDFWSQWDDVEELNENLSSEKTKLQSLKEGSDFMGHYHDHGEEKRIFDLPEPEKIQYCEKYRLLGNYLTTQGFYSKALEHFQIALSYYEYCFPEDAEAEAFLVTIRHACLSNASLCCLKLALHQECLQYASRIIKESKGCNAKAYFRRAQGFRAIDEYQLAMDDYCRALSLCPNGDPIIEQEVALLKRLHAAAFEQDKRVAKQMLGSKAPEVEQTSSSSAAATDLGSPAGGDLSTSAVASTSDSVDVNSTAAGRSTNSGTSKAGRAVSQSKTGTKPVNGSTTAATADELPKLLNIFLPLEPRLDLDTM